MFLLSSIKVEESIGFVQIFDFRFSMDLQVSGKKCIDSTFLLLSSIKVEESICFYANFRFPVLDGFTRYGMS